MSIREALKRIPVNGLRTTDDDAEAVRALSYEPWGSLSASSAEAIAAESARVPLNIIRPEPKQRPEVHIGAF